MKEIIFATGNASKGKRFADKLLEHGIKTLTLKDLDLKLDIEENGKNAIENARIKARECFRLTHKPSMGMDDTLYLEGVDEDKQPGLFVRRVNGKTLNDEEMIEHYINLVKQYGKDGRLDCKWIYGMVVINEDGVESEYTWSKDNIYMVDTLSNTINPGYPLNSFTKYKVIDKYLTDVTDEDKELIKQDESHVVDFIVNSLNKHELKRTKK